MKSSIIYLSLCFLTLGHEAQAQSLEECLDIAATHNLGLQASALHVKQAKTLERTFLDLDRTELSLGQDPTAGGSPDNAVTLSQGIDFPTVYTTRKRKLKADTRVAESRSDVALSELRRDVSIAYSALVMHTKEVELLRQNDSLMTEFVKIATLRQKNGESGRLEVLNAQHQKTDNDIKLKLALVDRAAALQELKRLLGTDADILPDENFTLSLSPEILASASFSDTPQGRLSASEKEQAVRQLKQVRQGYLPGFNLSFSQQCLLPAFNVYNIERSPFSKGNWMGFEVGIAVPLTYGVQRAKTSAAKLDTQIAELQQRQAEQEFTSRLQSALVEWQAIEEAVTECRTSTLPAAQEIRDISLVEFREGELSYSDYIQNLLTALDAELTAVQMTDKLHQAIININYLTGK